MSWSKFATSLMSKEEIKRIEEYERELKESGEDYYIDEFTGFVYAFEKKEDADKIWWVDTYNIRDGGRFSFDKKTVYSLFGDYPHKLTPEQKEIFDKENPYWADFFKDRPYEPKKQ